MPRILLIDGDMVAWNSASVSTESIGGLAVGSVRKQMRLLSADRAIVCFSDPSGVYFRHSIFAAYKSKRSERPSGLDEAKSALAAEFTSRTVAGLEADDVMGVLATYPKLVGEKIIVSADKDLLTVPGLHHNPRKDKPGVIREIDERDADFAHMRQTMIGDGTDNYPGCPGIGPKTVGRILWGETWQFWGQVLLAFRSRGKTEEDAILQARLARICRTEDYDFANKRAIPWAPRHVVPHVVTKAG